MQAYTDPIRELQENIRAMTSVAQQAAYIAQIQREIIIYDAIEPIRQMPYNILD